jgi:hypothetical protein
MTAIELPTDEATAGDQPIGLCLDCNYALRNLPSPRCPECGREFDPLDSKSMNMGRELPPLAKWVLGPVGWHAHALTLAAVAFALWYARLPGGQVRRSASLVIMTALGALWLAWPLLRWAVVRYNGWPHFVLMAGRKQRIAAGLVVLLAAVAIHQKLAMKVAFRMSRDQMNALAAETMADHTKYPKDRWVGVYPARHIRWVPGGMRFTVEDSDVSYNAGFIYLPQVDPKRVGWSAYHYVGDGWWTWREEG